MLIAPVLTCLNLVSSLFKSRLFVSTSLALCVVMRAAKKRLRTNKREGLNVTFAALFQFQYPEGLRQYEYIPNFAVRGLHYDVQKVSRSDRI